MAYTNEQIEKAKAAASVDELIALAKAEEIELSEEKAKAIFADLHAEEAELSDVELENVAGGGDCGNNTKECPGCHQEIEITYLVCPLCGYEISKGVLLPPV